MKPKMKKIANGGPVSAEGVNLEGELMQLSDLIRHLAGNLPHPGNVASITAFFLVADRLKDLAHGMVNCA